METELSQTTIQQEALAIGVQVDQKQAQQLLRYAELLLKWNSTYNLTSIRRQSDVLQLHLIDSLTLVGKFDSVAAQAKIVIDVGSGGGLPAVPLAIMRPDLQITMIDAVKKKVMFLRQVCASLRLDNARALHTRVEDLKEPQADVITSRAFASVKDMVSLTRHLLKKDGRWLAMKGKVLKEEMQEIPESVVVEKIVPLVLPDEEIERHLIVLKNIDSGN